jgi:hypothetical protein
VSFVIVAVLEIYVALHRNGKYLKNNIHPTDMQNRYKINRKARFFVF